MNPLENWTQTMGAGPLLLIALGAVLVLLALVIWARVHALVALVIVSLLTAFATGLPLKAVVPTIVGSFGTTLGSVALLVGLGAMLGRIIEVTGGAKALADRLIGAFGEKRAPLALGVASLLMGFPIFFDAGLVVMLPIIFQVARRLKGSLLVYGLPAAGAFSVMHVFVPPHPGPVAAAALFNANVGLVTALGLLVAVPTWYVTSYLFGLWSGKRIQLPVPAILGEASEEAEQNPPKFGTVLMLLLMPLVLIFLNTGLSTLAKSGAVPKETASAGWFAFLTVLGETPVALLITLLTALVVLGLRRGHSRQWAQDTFESALGPIASVVLITGAGGMFGGVLRASGIGDALKSSLESIGLPLIVAGFVIAAVLRVAQGSATVALTTAAGLIAPAVAAGSHSEVQLAALVIAVAAGSVVCSHVNDSGFWLVGRFMGMDVKTTFSTWTVLETAIGLMGFLLALGLWGIGAAL